MEKTNLFRSKFSYLSHHTIDSFPRICTINYKINSGFVSPEGPKIVYNTIHDFSVWQYGSNPADIKWFRMNTGKSFFFIKM